MREWTIWAEGYATTGQSGTAIMLGTVKADTFDAACEKLKETISQPYLLDRRPDGTWSYWGCQLFDNEHDARQAFG